MNHEQSLKVKIKQYKEKHDRLMSIADQKLVEIGRGLVKIKRLLRMV